MFAIKNGKINIPTAIYEWIEIGRDPDNLGEMYIDTNIALPMGNMKILVTASLVKRTVYILRKTTINTIKTF